MVPTKDLVFLVVIILVISGLGFPPTVGWPTDIPAAGCLVAWAEIFICVPEIVRDVGFSVSAI